MSDQMATGETAGLSVGSRPRAAAYLITATLALAFSYDLMRKPIQIPDRLICRHSLRPFLVPFCE